jgi:hypothetical protein
VQSAPYTRRQEARVSWLSLKTKFDGLSVVWPQKHWDGLSAVWPQNHWDGFSRFDLKIGGDSFSRFGLKTGGEGFSDLGLKTGSYGLVIWTSKSLRWFLDLGHKPSRLRFVGCATKPTRGR